MAASWIRRSCLLPAFLVGLSLAAQPGPSTIDSLRAAVRLADSTGNAMDALEGRLLLAPLAGPAEVRTVLLRAAAMADSLDRPDLGASAYRLLAARSAQEGRMAGAYKALLRADSLERNHGQREVTRVENEGASVQGSLAQQRDSIATAAQGEQRRLALALYHMEQRSDAWMYAALASLAIGLLVATGLLYRLGQVGQRQASALEELRQELARAVRNRPAAAGPQERTHPVATPPGPGAGTLAAGVDKAMAPVASGMFRKDAPERLTTLLDARKRGDAEKVLRVLATLKPQLLAYDAARFAPLIAALRAPDAAAHATQWNKDLDLLEAAIRELWAHHGGQ